MVRIEVVGLSVDATRLIVGIICVGLADTVIEGSTDKDSSGVELGVVEGVLLGLTEFSKEVVSEGGIDEVLSGVPCTIPDGDSDGSRYLLVGEVVNGDDSVGDTVGTSDASLDGSADSSIEGFTEGTIDGKV